MAKREDGKGLLWGASGPPATSAVSHTSGPARNAGTRHSQGCASAGSSHPQSVRTEDETQVVTREIVCCLQMGPNAYYYLTPVGDYPAVDRLWIVRSSQLTRGDIPKARYILVPARWKPLRFVQMLWHALRLGRRREVKAFVSFNPIPYGLIQLLAASLYRKPIHFGFVGSDWYRHGCAWYAPLLRPFFRRGDFVTATGPRMRQQMIGFGLDADKIAILPHAIDLEHYPVADPEAATYTCIFVGQLIRRKRVDLILSAFAIVRAQHPYSRLCIVGDGPLREVLEAQAVELGIADAVDFVGFVSDVQPFLARSRIDVIASDMEGMPFALIEGMVSGLVPISTRVGTIEDWITDGENGLLVPVGDAAALAKRICHLLDDDALFERLRAKVLQSRDLFSMEHAMRVWDGWLRTLW